MVSSGSRSRHTGQTAYKRKFPISNTPHLLATYLRLSPTSACLLMSIYVLCSVYWQQDRVYTVHFIYRTVYQHGYEDVTIHTINIQEQTILQNSPYIKSPRPITIFPGAVLAVADRLLWVGLNCQSLRRFSRLTLLPRELSTNTIVL